MRPREISVLIKPMEHGTKSRIEERLDTTNHDDMEQWRQSLERHLQTGEDAWFWIKDEQALVEFAALIGYGPGVKRVVGYYYICEEFNKFMTDSYETELPIIALQERIADIGMMNQFPNDYDLRVAVEVDAETVIIYDVDSNSVPVVCEECMASEDEDLQEELALNPQYGCGHLDDEYFTRNSVTMMKTPADNDELYAALVHRY